MHFVITRRAPLDTPDGINISIFSLADALQADGHRVTMVSATESDPARLRELYGIRNVPSICSLSSRRGWDGSYRRLFGPWLRRGRRAVDALAPDLVIVNGALPLRFQAPSCVVSHDLEQRFDFLGPIRTIYKRWTYRLATFVVATCTEVQELLSREIGLPARRITVIPTCFDLTVYRSLPLVDRMPAILHMGTVEYKNPAATVRAFAEMRYPARLYITGGQDRQLQTELQGLPRDVRDRIELLGYVPSDALRRLLAGVRVVSVPSQYSVPVASPSVIEAFASSTPVIASRSISRDVITHDLNGYVSSLDPADMAARFDQLMADDSAWSRLSEAALETSARFSSRAVAERYASLAETARGARSSRRSPRFC
jgi:glycosyltransferase involved in cell wall biosynthesis